MTHAGSLDITTEEPVAPGVSCVMIFLNGDQFIDEAIRSVVGQQGFDDWELLLVDDGSTDESSQIARSWAKAIPDRVRYLEHPDHENRGMSASRNLGIREGRGELVAFLDCDDVWLPSALAHRIRVLEQHPTADVVAGGTWRWYGWDGSADSEAADRVIPLPPYARAYDTMNPPSLFAQMYATPADLPLPLMCSLLFRRDALLRVGGLEESFRGLHEDQVLYSKLAIHLRVVMDPRPLALYRFHDQSSVEEALVGGTWKNDQARFLEWLDEYVRQELGEASPELDVVRFNHAYWFSEQSRAERLRSQLRERVPAPLLARFRAVKDRKRGEASDERRNGLDVVAVWCRQHLGAWLGSGIGRVVIVDDAVEGSTASALLPPGLARPDDITTIAFDALDEAAALGAGLVVVPVAVTAARAPGDVLKVLAAATDDRATIVVFAPGPGWFGALAPVRETRSGAALGDDGRDHFPSRRVARESFGNRVTASAVASGLSADLVPGVLIDDHRSEDDVMHVLTISPSGATSPGREASDDR